MQKLLESPNDAKQLIHSLRSNEEKVKFIQEESREIKEYLTKYAISKNMYDCFNLNVNRLFRRLG